MGPVKILRPAVQRLVLFREQMLSLLLQYSLHLLTDLFSAKSNGDFDTVAAGLHYQS